MEEVFMIYDAMCLVYEDNKNLKRIVMMYLLQKLLYTCMLSDPETVEK